TVVIQHSFTHTVFTSVSSVYFHYHFVLSTCSSSTVLSLLLKTFTRASFVFYLVVFFFFFFFFSSRRRHTRFKCDWSSDVCSSDLFLYRDTLFSFHPVSERFLEQMMALYVASHYKNSPNDLQLMSDAPAHQLFVLVPPIPDNTDRLPEPLCVIQVALEVRISRQSVLSSLSLGQRAG